MSAGYLQINNEQVKIVSGHIAAKKGWLYCVLNIPNADGVCKPKWIATHLKEKGNKTAAKNMLPGIRAEWTKKAYLATHELVETKNSQGTTVYQKAEEVKRVPLFHELLDEWLEYKYKLATNQALAKRTIELNTYSGYEMNVRNPVGPYFKELAIPINELTKEIIERFYEIQLVEKKKVVSTVKHYHAVIHGALEYAIDQKLLTSNPASRIFFPQEEKFKGDYYTIEEVMTLFEKVKGTKLEMPVVLAAFYGLRRSEVLGLKWNAFNFTNNVFSIRHTVTSCEAKGKKHLIAKDRGKSKKSRRSLPLVPFIRDWLLEMKEQQAHNRKLCGRSYNKKYLDYLCVDPLGDLIHPDYVSSAFPNMLKKYGLRHIRFHDLRHTCAALLAANKVPIEDIMDWLGHSDIKITSEFYLHLEYYAKVSSAVSLQSTFQSNAVSQILLGKQETEEKPLDPQEEIRNLKAQITSLQFQLEQASAG